MNSNAKILVGCLHTDENEFDRCIRSIEAQQGVDFDYFVIENLPNKQAHDALYERFNQSADHYGYFLKMDADMVFRTPEALRAMREFFEKDPTIDHLMMDVWDWPSQMLIPGQNMWTHRVRWKGNPSTLIVDYNGTYSGKLFRVDPSPSPSVEHMPDPSPFQAFAYGVHKAVKAIQPKESPKVFWRALLHWTILNRIYLAHRYEGDIRRLYALAGANAVLLDPEPAKFRDYKAKGLRREFFDAAVMPLTEQALREQAYWKWENQCDHNTVWLNLFKTA